MSSLDDEALQDYLTESREHLASIEADLLAIEQRGADIDEDCVNKVFRAAHSIKGGAGFFDLTRIRELAHKTENVLELIRSRTAVPTPPIVNTLLLAFDKLRDLIDNHVTSEHADICSFVTMLEELAAAHLPGARQDAARPKAVISTTVRQTRLSLGGLDFDLARKSGKLVYLLEYDLLQDIQRKNLTPIEVVKELMRFGTILETNLDLEAVGTLEESPGHRLLLDVLYATALGPELIASVVEIPSERIWTVGRDGSSQPVAMPCSGQPEGATEIAPPTPEPLPRAPEKAAPEPANDGPAPADATVRLNVALLDALMNLAGELVLGRNQLTDAIARQDPAEIQAASQRISVVTTDVQDAVMRTRMQPVGNLFQKFPRLVRDTAHKLGKEVQLIEEGGDVELDKTIIEGLSDPLTHMVRNAIDHGIESAEVRQVRGKPPAGRLSLRAWHEAGLVVVEVADDGKGLDPEKIAATAIGKGLIAPDAAAGMSEEEKLALVFLPGLSTAERVSDLSGRGVGMDVVKSNLDRMRGSIEIHSQPGRGAAFRIKLPLTLAIIPSLLVSTGPDRMAIPLENVQELVRIPAADLSRRIDRVGSASVLMPRDGVIPLLHLHRVLDLASTDAGTAAALNVVVLSGGTFRYGLVVERLHGTVEIVVKPLGRHLKHLREYVGATILGDGCVALILDVAGLAGVAGLAPQEGRVAKVIQEESASQELHQLLLFRNSPREACAVPLHTVSRVLKIRPEDVEHVGGRRTIQHSGRSLPVVMLADTAKAEPVALDQGAIVVVMETGGRDFGLLASQPVDVVEAALEIDPYTFRQPGVAGSAVWNGMTLLVLDAAELGTAAHPDRQTRPLAVRNGADAPTILVADDSAFFREQVVKILEREGLRTLTAPDGQAAWEIIGQRARELALVITDIEMPRLDGLQLTRRIRAARDTAALPIVMLTALAGEDDVERGRAAGATAYCVKLDPDRLLDTVRGLLPQQAASSPSGLLELSRHVSAEEPVVLGERR